VLDEELTTAQVATSLGITQRAVCQAIHRGQLATRTVITQRGKEYWVSRRELERYIEYALGDVGRKVRMKTATNTEVTIQVGDKPVVVHVGPATLNAVAIETLVAGTDPLVGLWIYDATEPRGGAGYPYERELNGRSRALDSGLTTRYERGMVAVIMPRPHYLPVAAKVPTLTFTFYYTVD